MGALSSRGQRRQLLKCAIWAIVNQAERAFLDLLFPLSRGFPRLIPHDRGRTANLFSSSSSAMALSWNNPDETSSLFCQEPDDLPTDAMSQFSIDCSTKTTCKGDGERKYLSMRGRVKRVGNAGLFIRGEGTNLQETPSLGLNGPTKPTRPL